MYNYRNLVLVAIAILALIVPELADARAGGGRSSGSMGSRTYSSRPSAAPIQRSTTAPAKPSPQAGFAQTSQPGFAQKPAPSGNSFWHGLAGGFLGAGIGSMLFGGGGVGYGGGMGGGYGGGGVGGGLLQILLLGGVIYFLYRIFKSSSLSKNVSNMSNFSRDNIQETEADPSTPLVISSHDKEYFEQLLVKIQNCWSEGDLTKMRQLVTPEMLQYFSEELSANASRGLANKVDQVKLQRADISESWSEFGLDYTTARLQWSAVDYMVHLDKNPTDSGYIASGSGLEPQIAEEFWTFVRSGGGNWLLSAIQQIQ
jgi:hypothetical protein